MTKVSEREQFGSERESRAITRDETEIQVEVLSERTWSTFKC